MDLATDAPLTSSPKMERYKSAAGECGECGPLPSGAVGTISGRSGLTSQGFIVHPGIVDGASKEDIKIIHICDKGAAS